jgi:hypothetical protein
LLQRAGIRTGIRAVLQFIPPDLEARLLALEKSHKGRDVNEIRRTVFRVEREGDGFAFVVDRQEYF